MIWIPTAIVMLITTVVAFFDPFALIILLLVDALMLYFFLTSLFGYVELREDTVFVKFGFLTSKEIPYNKIRGISREKKFYADSLQALKNSYEHINIKYNRFDMVSVSVTDNDELIAEIKKRMTA